MLYFLVESSESDESAPGRPEGSAAGAGGDAVRKGRERPWKRGLEDSPAAEERICEGAYGSPPHRLWGLCEGAIPATKPTFRCRIRALGRKMLDVYDNAPAVHFVDCILAMDFD